MKTVLFVSHSNRRCGVWNYGWQTGQILSRATGYSYLYCEANSEQEFLSHLYSGSYDSVAAVIFNYCGSTLPWLTADTIAKITVPSACLVHDECCPFPNMRWHIHIDPTHPECIGHFRIGRPIPLHMRDIDPPERLTIGSFGFGFSNKAHLVELVQSQFDDALIRLHIPYAHYGDIDGAQARKRADEARACVRKPGIELEITHDYMAPADLLDWLASNTLNAFIYDVNYGRGCASTTDYALAVPRPIALSDSWQFRHLPSKILRVEYTPLKTIIEIGNEYLKSFRYNLWTAYRLCSDYDRIVNRMLGDKQC